MNELFNVFDSLFTPFLTMQGYNPVEETMKKITLPVDMIVEEDGTNIIKLAIPGKSEKNVKLTKQVKDGVNYLIFDLQEDEQPEDEKKAEEEKASKRQVEITKIKITKHCAWKIPNTVDLDKLDAVIENGLLTITIPAIQKSEEEKPFEFTIRSK